ncbi:transmembrane protein, putative (macronuclear) [Tetrahymena thermophila SB210]|uniref:Transmembrane protein, putative n=1 Tax=Tetrahymena thermophila (strain SB210) TaxID=312017 RepID=Q23A04_TETTS|nr:transmembrane protein, putative [Tetrahymena thermophila SB210]EAR93359.2 transmembrane protein, putative [Tetrahymena thermophila SB210]|eukprot:XP_001013604.2 transmembrane protein, putative [Tetrahymena thermophila SB210]
MSATILLEVHAYLLIRIQKSFQIKYYFRYQKCFQFTSLYYDLKSIICIMLVQTQCLINIQVSDTQINIQNIKCLLNCLMLIIFKLKQICLIIFLQAIKQSILISVINRSQSNQLLIIPFYKKLENQIQILYKMNMILFIIFILHLILTFIRCDQCSALQSQDSCQQTTGCKWVENNSNIFCTSRDFGCSKLDLKTCSANDKCIYQPAMSGGCQLDRSVSCQGSSYIQCQYLGQRCNWQSIFKCENFSDGFNCSSKNQQQCTNSSNYCSSQFQCQASKDQTLCSFKNKSDCLAASSYCQYSITTPQSCNDLGSYCKNLSGPDCMADSNFCSFQQVTPSSCTNKSDASICGKLSLSDCNNASQFCYQIQTPYTCTNKVTNATCAGLLDQTTCAQNIGCAWINNICSIIVDCTTLNQQQCESQQYSSICTSNPSQTVCQNKQDFGCSQYNSQSSLCQQYSSYCSYQQFTGNCSSKNYCQNLKQSDCLSASSKCVFQPEIGSCQLSSNINCNGLNQATCQSTSYCVYQFLSCSDQNQDLCSAFSLDQCTANNKFCDVSIQGTCQDNAQLNCQKYSQQNCSQNQGCVFYKDTPESCSNIVNCSKFSQQDCIQNSDFCIYTSQNGMCSADSSQVAEKSSILLKINIFAFLLSVILLL